MNKEMVHHYNDNEYLFDCSHGRLREIIHELCAELLHYQGEFKYPEDFNPNQVALDIIKANKGVGTIMMAVTSALRHAAHMPRPKR